MKKSVQLAVRFDSALVKEIEAERRRLSKESNGVRVTLSDAIRYLVRGGLSKPKKPVLRRLAHPV